MSADEWVYTSERGVPHALCCAPCKAAQAELETLRAVMGLIAKDEALSAETHRLMAQDALTNGRLGG